MERLADEPLEIWDGAHNLGGVGWLLPRLPASRYVVVASILADKDAEGMLAALSALGDRFIATSSSNERALPAGDLGVRAGRFFADVKVIPDPLEALAQGRELVGDGEAVLVTGSLYLLADLAVLRPVTAVPWRA